MTQKSQTQALQSADMASKHSILKTPSREQTSYDTFYHPWDPRKGSTKLDDMDIYNTLLHGIPRDHDIRRQPRSQSSTSSSSSTLVDFHNESASHDLASPAMLIGAVGSLTKSMVAFAFQSRFGLDPFQETRRREHHHRE